MITFNLKSSGKKSPLAPEYWLVISELDLNGIDWESISSFILFKEREIKQLNIPFNYLDDGQTLLGTESLTAHFKYFNVFKWDHPEINKLKTAVYEKYLYLLSELDIPRSRTWIQCWANVLRDGEKIALHSHGLDEYTYLSGHITVQSNNTSTVYINPMTCGSDTEEISNFNLPGKVTFFTSNIPHYTTTHTGSRERISIAFDIFLGDGTYLLDQHAIKNLVLFDNL
jgi:hypothetical protein